MSGFSRDRNVKIPKKTDKKSNSKPSQYLPTRPAEGRRDVPKKVEQKPRTNQRPNNQRRQGQKQRGNRGRGNTSRDRPQRQRRPTPLDDEVWARVGENDPQTNVIVAFGESKMLLGRFTAKNTNCSVLVNTSFNVRGEPIVCSIQDAFNCFMGTELDVLVIGNCFLWKEEQDLKLKKNYNNLFKPD